MSFDKFFNWRNGNIAGELIKKYPNVSYEELKGHESISSKFISKNMDKNWNFYNFTGKFIKDKVSFDFIFKYKEKNWDWSCLTIYFGFSVAQNHPELPWDWNIFFQNGDITSSFLEENLDNILSNWMTISLYYFYRNFPDIVLKYPKPFWSIIDFSRSVPLYFVEQNLDYNWDWGQLSSNSTLTWDIVKKYPVKPWNIPCLLKNLDVDIDLIETVPGFFHQDNLHLILTLISNGNPACMRLKIFKTLQSRQTQFKIIFENLSPFSRNIDKIIRKRINYI